METILELIMYMVEKTYMIAIHTLTLITTSYKFAHVNSYRELNRKFFVTCICLLDEAFHPLKTYGC